MKTTNKLKSKYDVPSLKTGFEILEHLSHHPRGCVLTDITAVLKCPVSSAYRIAMALEDMGLVSRDPETKQIRLTTKLLQLGQRAITETNLVEHALDIMRELRDRVVDTVLIGVREGTDVIVLDQIMGARMFCFVSKLGYRVGVSCSAPGKAILAFLPEKERGEIVAAIKFVRFNDRTITSKERLRIELAAVAEKGYAFDDSEQFEGIYCMGAPIFDRCGYPVAAVWTTGLMMDIERKHIPEIGAVVKSHADRISARLGYAKGMRTLMAALGMLAVTAFVSAGPSVRVEDEVRKALTMTSGSVAQDRVTSIAFPAQQTKVVRMVIRATNGGSAGLDELELFAPDGKENLALAARGTVARASSVISGHAIHAVAHLNDGEIGNDHSWIAATPNEEWVEIELPQATMIARVDFSRDRTGKYTDRIPKDVEIMVSLDGKAWTMVSKKSCHTKAPPSLSLPASALTEPTWKGIVEYAFRCERDTWGRMDAKDELSPLVKDRPAIPGGAPYWGRIARLSAVERVLVQFEEMIARLAAQGVAVTKEQGELTSLRSRMKAEGESDALYLAARYAKRRLFFRDPRLAPVERVLFAKQHPLEPSHNYSDHMDAHFVSGGGVYVLHVPRDAEDRLDPASAEVEMLFDGSAGIVRHPVADFDGQNLFFAYRPEKPEVEGWASYWHMWTLRADGSGVRKLTGGPFHDFDPVPLPDGSLGFISTRCVSRFLCWQPQAYVLYRMNRDGSDMKRLSFANLSEWDPSMTRDGRILWTRSEYLDKGADFGHTLWSIRPDGTHPELVFGNDTPYCYGHAREVPDSQELVCTLISHGDHQGPIALIDRSKGLYDTAALTSITPDTRPQYQMDRSHQETFRFPEPISRDHFLVSHSPGPRSHWGLYVIDRYGNRELLYLDPTISSKKPSLLRTRVRPPVLQDVSDANLAAQGLGQFTVQDVYEGLGPTVPRGRAKYVQVSHEVPPMLEKLQCGEYRSTHPPFTDFYATPVHKVKGPAHEIVTRTQNALGAHAFRQGSAVALSNGLITVTERGGWPSYVAKAVIGTVPVSEDGSVNFTAPAGKVLYFQLLDENYNEIQRMRSVVQLQPGERRSCVGCHDDRLQLPQMKQTTKALAQPVRTLEPPPWGSQPFGYERVVQPVLNKRCISCHNGSKKERIDLRGTLDADLVPVSYRSLVSGGWVHYFDWMYGARPFKAEPLTFGTLHSRLFEMLAKKAHESAKLETSEMRALKAWVDLNCPLWPDYTYRPERSAAHP